VLRLATSTGGPAAAGPEEVCRGDHAICVTGVSEPMIIGLNDRSCTYDRAERLTNVKVTGGSSLIDLAYATANGSGDYANGKLRTATRHNWVLGVDNQV
jgi:hypothetical protein